MLKVGFLGNCQAQAMESWTSHARDSLEIVNFPAIWLLNEQDVGKILEDIEICDYVFTQRLSDDFTWPDLATSRLKGEFGSKLISWPNAYFDGYFPGVSYRYKSDGRILGPLDEYHWDPIENSFLAGESVDECVARLNSDAIFELYPDPIAKSLQRLGDREVGLDVVISDYIASNLHNQRLFYSMNHPVNSLILEIIERLFGLIGERKRVSDIGAFGFPLNKIILPVLPSIASQRHINFSDRDSIKGIKVCFGDEGYQISDEAEEYDYSSLVECFYKIYEINARSLNLISQY